MKRILKNYLPKAIKNRLIRIKTQSIPRVASTCANLLGYNVSRQDDFYSPLPTISHIQKHIDRWYRPSELTAIKYDLEQMKTLLSELLEKYLVEFLTIPPYGDLKARGFGLGYTPVDALTLYLMVRHLKPEHYIEVGSGLSTYYCHLAALRNTQEGSPLRITCIEPHPFKNLYSIPEIEVIPKEVQDVELELFTRLQPGDIIFIDSSHMLRIDSDVAYLYLEVLPRVAPGIHVHVHDVPFPYNIPYPPTLWVFGRAEPMLWNEAMILQAFLCFNDAFRIVLSTPLLRHFCEDFLRDNIPIYTTVEQEPNTFSSLWLTRVA